MSFDPDSAIVANRLCDDFVYVASKGPFYVPHRTFMTLDGFRQFVGQHYGFLNFTRIVDGNEVQDKIAAAEWWLQTRPEGKRVVSEVVFEPGINSPPEKFNTWDRQKLEMCTPNLHAQLTDIRPLIEHLLFIFDEDAESVVWFMNWLAHLYQFPEIKIPSYIVMHSQFGRVGKSMLKHLLGPVFGTSMVRSMGGHLLHGDFSDPLFGARIIFVEEVAFENRRSTYEKFKELVSEPVFSHNPKGQAARQVMNTAHFIVCTNRIDALPLMNEDPRALVVSCPKKPKEQSYYREFVRWMTGPGVPLLAGVLANWDLSEFDAGGHAPQTEAGRMMFEASVLPLDKYVMDLIAERAPPFDKDFGQLLSIVNHMAIVHQAATAHMGLSAHTLGRALKTAGAVRKNMRVSTTQGPKYTWVWRNQQKWDSESPEARAAHLGTT